MEFVVDHFSLTGASHIPKGLGCQDYAMSGIPHGAAYAVVCDGSSCADPEKGEPDRTARTAVGASSLALITANAIAAQWAQTGLASHETQQAVSVQQRLALPTIRATLGLAGKDMLATCIYALVSPQGGFVHVQGDGVLAIRFYDGSVRVMRWDWDGNAPFYPAYAIFGDPNAYAKSKGGWDAEAVSEQSWRLEHDGDALSIIADGNRKVTVREGVNGVFVPLSADEVAAAESIVIMSDGIGSVATPSLRPEFLDWREMVWRMFTRWGNPLPNFALARMDRWQQRDIKALGAVHQDDLSIAAIRRKADG